MSITRFLYYTLKRIIEQVVHHAADVHAVGHQRKNRRRYTLRYNSAGFSNCNCMEPVASFQQFLQVEPLVL